MAEIMKIMSVVEAAILTKLLLAIWALRRHKLSTSSIPTQYELTSITMNMLTL